MAYSHSHISIATTSDLDHQSPKFRTSSQSDEFSSTPHTSFIRPDATMDLSAISSIPSEQSILAQARVQPSFFEGFKPAPKKEKESFNQSELDILFNSYIQWTYLDQCLQKKVKDDERSFMTQTHVLFQENERLRSRVADLDKQIAEAKYLKDLDSLLEASNAHNVVKGLDDVKTSHSDLAESLDTTRHQLPLEGIYLPCDTETYSDYLTDTLREALRAAEKLEESLGMDPKALEECSIAAKTLLNNFEEMGEGLEFTGELTRELRRLTVQESSLVVQKIMEKDKV